MSIVSTGTVDAPVFEGADRRLAVEEAIQRSKQKDGRWPSSGGRKWQEFAPFDRSERRGRDNESQPTTPPEDS